MPVGNLASLEILQPSGRAKVSNNILILITSPFQYWCAQEFLHQHSLLDRRITVINGASFCANSMIQIDRLHRRLVTVNEKTLVIPSNTSLDARIAPYASIAHELNKHDFEKVLIGDLREIWMQDIACFLDCSDIILVDDGAATNVFVEKLIAPSNFKLPIALHSQSESRRHEATKIKEQYGLFLKGKEISLFSIFPFPHYPNTIQNGLSVLKQLFSNTTVKANEECHFIGSPVVEKGIVAELEYYDILSHARTEIGKNTKLTYFAHRAEALETKRAYLETLGFDIEQHDEPYELVCATQGRKPSMIFGMHSTSLFNMKILLDGKIRAVCYKLNNRALSHLEEKMGGSDKFSLREHIESIYKRLNEFSIESQIV